MGRRWDAEGGPEGRCRENPRPGQWQEQRPGQRQRLGQRQRQPQGQGSRHRSATSIRDRGTGAWLQLCSPRTKLCAWHPLPSRFSKEWTLIGHGNGNGNGLGRGCGGCLDDEAQVTDTEFVPR
jgi:hypothetical protein